MASHEPQLGAVVEIPVGRGVVRFAGTTSFAAGKWIGIELYEGKGKNDGSIGGVSYFQCKMNYGVFVRPSQVKVIVAEPPPAVPAVAAVAAASASSRRPSLSVRASGSSPRVPSVRSSVPPGSPRATSPPKAGTSPAPNGRSRLGPGPPSPTKRTPPTATASPSVRASISGHHRRKSSIDPTASNLNGSAPRTPKGGTPPQGLPSTSRPLAFKIPKPPAPEPTPPPPPPRSPTPPPRPVESPTNPLADVPPPSSSPLLSEQPPPQFEAELQELQELRAKIRVLEAKRADDARHVRELEIKLSEAESFVALRPKLQAKLNSQQTELIATRRELADAQQLSELSESRMLDVQEQLEMSMLDKEVAEERAEVAEAELEELREKLAVAEVELEVMKEKEQSEGIVVEEGTDPQVSGSLAYIQLEKQNARLKEALVRLRDITSETEQENRKRIAEMEKDIMDVEELHAELESTLIKLSNAENQVEDLKLQLDDALGAEEMLVQLTERNLMLSEKIEEMRITIEDLEALKELSDELEENHVDTEKALQEDINEKDMEIHNQKRKIESLEEVCQDLEGTIVQFRELVLQLQSELDKTRNESQTVQSEYAAAASQSAAVMSLNMKLQSTASKNQAKNIDLEVKRIESKEARELLTIVQPYLPQVYVESDSDATNCYMFFQRMALKADLINSVSAQVHGLPDSLNGSVTETLVGVCEMRGSIAYVSTLCKRFAAILRRCDVDTFLNVGRLYPEIAPMEKRLDMHIDLLRREEFRELECVSDIAKIQAQFDHLAETYFEGFDLDVGERELGFVLTLDHDLDIYASSVGLAKTAVEGVLKDEDMILELGELDPQVVFFEPIQKSLDQYKAAKTISRKLTRRLEDLTHESSALKAGLAPQLKSLSNLVSELVNFGIQLAQQTMPHVSDAKGSKTPFQLSKVLNIANEVATSTVWKSRKDVATCWGALSDAILQVIAEANALLPITMDPSNVVKLTGIPPWVRRVDEVKAALAVNVEAERKVAQLNEEMQGLVRNLKLKEQNVQESTVKIELMERRMETVKKQADTIADLEGELGKARKQERAYEDAIEQLQADLDNLEQENQKLKAAGANPERQASGVVVPETENIQIEGNLETSHLLEQIEAFRGAVRYLRQENAYLKGQDLLKEIQELPPLPSPSVSRLPTPALVASGLSDTDDSDGETPSTPPTLRSLATERKVLYRDVIKFSSNPRIVDLSVRNSKSADGTARPGVAAWLPKKKMPAYQVWERKMEAERLSRRVKGLLERTSTIGTSR